MTAVERDPDPTEALTEVERLERRIRRLERVLETLHPELYALLKESER